MRHAVAIDEGMLDFIVRNLHGPRDAELSKEQREQLWEVRQQLITLQAKVMVRELHWIAREALKREGATA